MIRTFASSLRPSVARPQFTRYALFARRNHNGSRTEEEREITRAEPLLQFVQRKVTECSKLRSEVCGSC